MDQPDKPASTGRAHFCPGCLGMVDRAAQSCPQCDMEPSERGWPVDRFVGRLVDGKYRIERRLGAGGFALVFLAQQVRGNIELGPVVLKFLHQMLADNKSVRRRFVNEAKAARKVGSPHVVKVFDLGFDDDGMPFMAMEYLEGDSLDQVLQRRPSGLPPERTLRIASQVAAAVEACHQEGIIHRDLKPDNLMLVGQQGEDFVKVLDFGIARVPTTDAEVTRTMMGTPRYMPPEQILQQEIDTGADIFALGVIIYECLTGRPPIKGRTAMEYLQSNLNVSPTPLRQVKPSMPAELELLLGRMMAKNRADRPPSMADVALRLRAIAETHGWIGGRRRSTMRSTEELPLAPDEDTPETPASCSTPPPQRTHTTDATITLGKVASPQPDVEPEPTAGPTLDSEPEPSAQLAEPLADAEPESPVEAAGATAQLASEPPPRRSSRVWLGAVLLLGLVAVVQTLWRLAAGPAPGQDAGAHVFTPGPDARPPVASPRPDAAATAATPDQRPPDAPAAPRPDTRPPTRRTRAKPPPRPTPRSKTTEDEWGTEKGGL